MYLKKWVNVAKEIVKEYIHIAKICIHVGNYYLCCISWWNESIWAGRTSTHIIIKKRKILSMRYDRWSRISAFFFRGPQMLLLYYYIVTHSNYRSADRWQINPIRTRQQFWQSLDTTRTTTKKKCAALKIDKGTALKLLKNNNNSG